MSFAQSLRIKADGRLFDVRKLRFISKAGKNYGVYPLPSHKILTYKIDITKVEDIPEEFRVWINRSDP